MIKMSFGKRIKELRKSQDITQEKLAEYLCISFQAISKWENDTAFPDIKMLKPLSNFFGVSIDFLLENENNEEDTYVSSILEQLQKLNNQGKVEKAIRLLRKALKNYPRNYLLMSKLSQALVTITKSTHEHDMEKNAKEAIEICDRIIDDSNDYELIDSAIRTTFYANIDLKNYEKAIEIANKRPSIWHSKELLLTAAYQGSEANEYIQKSILQLMDMFTMHLFSLTYKRYGAERYSTQDKIRITKTTINIIESILYDENYQFYSNRLRRFYTFLAIYYAQDNQKEMMYDSLDKAKQLAIYYDSLDSDQKYTSLFTDTVLYQPSTTVVNAEWNDFHVFKDRLKRKEFDGYRDEARFQKYYKQ